MNLIRNSDFEETEGSRPGTWEKKTWAGSGSFRHVDGGRVGSCVMIESSGDGGDIGWRQVVKVKPDTIYRLSGWIRTEGLSAGSGTGALLNVHELQRASATEAVTGDAGWTRVESIVRSGQHEMLSVLCLFGGWGLSTGKAWYDDIILEELDMESFSPSVTIDAEKKSAPINPFIYGQFIEHLGRCIYGGIWAEMLEDRKFYFPITGEYNPYRSLEESPFPVVGASPWEIIGEPDAVTMVQEGSFVGEHTPSIAAGAGIRQNDLAIVSGKDYTGRIWLKGDSAGSRVTVSLVWGDEAEEREQLTVTVTDEFREYPLRFTAGATTDSASLVISVSGEGACSVGTVSLMPGDNVRGMRRDTLELLKQLDSPMSRWPGGNFVSGYDWRDGIGDPDRRPPRKNPAWTGVEHNDFGLDEFIDFCGEVNAEPLIAVNTGFGDACSAAQQVEYCNGSTDTLAGAWRAENGHGEPYGVTYWCVGNEMFGPWQLGFMQLKHYTQKHNRVARAMLSVDPSIELIGVGALGCRNSKHDPNEKRGWSRGILENCAEYTDYLSEHFYSRERCKDPREHVHSLAQRIRRKAEGHRRMQPELKSLAGRIVPIAMDEWNYWHGDYVYGELGCRYDLADALGVAAGLHEYFRQSDIIQMAHYAQTVNVIGCIKTTKTDAFLATTALPLMLYRREFGSIPVPVEGNQESIDLDVVAALDKNRKILTLGIVNPNRESSKLKVTLIGIQIRREGTVHVISGDDPAVVNDADNERVTIESQTAEYNDGTLELPGLSISLYRFAVQ